MTRVPSVASERDVASLLDALDAAGVVVHVDGGWGVDALLGRETRSHGDLDLAVARDQERALLDVLVEQGFTPRERPDTTQDIYAMGREAFEVDLHLYEFEEGEAIASSGVAYPRASLAGVGRIGGRTVLCIAPEWVLQFHSGYPLDADDLHDVVAVAERFDLELLSDHRAALSDQS